MSKYSLDIQSVPVPLCPCAPGASVSLYAFVASGSSGPCFTCSEQAPWSLLTCFLVFPHMLRTVPWYFGATPEHLAAFSIPFVFLNGHSRFTVTALLWRRSENANGTFSCQCSCVAFC